MVRKIKSTTIILEKSDGRILLCKRSPDLAFFPGLFVFPGGKIDDKLPEDWIGDEPEVKLNALRELFEEVGILAGSNKAFTAEERINIDPQDNISQVQRDEFKAMMTFVGRRQTPEFQEIVFDTAYYLISGKIVDQLEAIPDGNEILEVLWVLPAEMLTKWNEGKVFMPPPTTHTLRNLRDHRERFESLSLVEMNLPIGLQTKVEFAEGIEAIPYHSNTIPPFVTTTLVVVKSQDGCLIVDPGAKTSSHKDLRLYLQSLDYPPKVFLTHHHSDHWDALPLIEDLYPNVEIFAHPSTLSKISTSLKTSPVVGGTLKIGSMDVEMIHTPGHTEGHMCLYVAEKRLLIAGDHVVGKGSAVLSLADGDMKLYLDSTLKLKNLDPKIIIPGHGPPTFEGTKLLEKYMAHRLDRESSILNAINQGSNTLDLILKSVYTDVPKEMWEYAKSNIILHVRKLNQEGKTDLQFTIS